MIRVGATMVCTECGRALYRIIEDLGAGDVIPANGVQPLAGQGEPETGQPVECPTHGIIQTYLIPPPGPFPEPAEHGLRLRAWNERGALFILDDHQTDQQTEVGQKWNGNDWFDEVWRGMTVEQQQRIRDKATWEHTSLPMTLMEWPTLAPEELRDLIPGPPT